MKKQLPSKPIQRVILLMITATALTGAMIVYRISQVKQTLQQSKITVPKIQQITALGRLEPVSEVIKVSVPMTLSKDRVAKLMVQRGERIQKGQVIAILASSDRLQSALKEAQEQVKITQAELAKVRAGAKSGEIAAQKAEIARLQANLQGEIATQQATSARWQAELNTASADYNRYLSLYQQGAISASDLDQRRLKRETTQAQLNEIKANKIRTAETVRQQIQQAKATLEQIAEIRPVDVQATAAQVEKAEAAVEQAQTNLAEATILAPISGRILEIHSKPGETVSDNGIAELAQTDQMEVVAEVYQTDINKIKAGQLATISSSSLAEKISGNVRLIGLQVSQQTVSSGTPGENLDRRIVEVRIRINPEDSQRIANLTNLQVQVAIKL